MHSCWKVVFGGDGGRRRLDNPCGGAGSLGGHCGGFEDVVEE